MHSCSAWDASIVTAKEMLKYTSTAKSCGNPLERTLMVKKQMMRMRRRERARTSTSTPGTSPRLCGVNCQCAVMDGVTYLHGPYVSCLGTHASRHRRLNQIFPTSTACCSTDGPTRPSEANSQAGHR